MGRGTNILRLPSRRKGFCFTAIYFDTRSSNLSSQTSSQMPSPFARLYCLKSQHHSSRIQLKATSSIAAKSRKRKRRRSRSTEWVSNNFNWHMLSLQKTEIWSLICGTAMTFWEWEMDNVSDFGRNEAFQKSHTNEFKLATSWDTSFLIPP